MKKLNKLILLLLIACFFSHCQAQDQNLLNSDFQITEAGNPPAKPKKLRAITGSLGESEQCLATGVRVTDSTGQIKDTPLDDNCTFNLELVANKVWDLKILYQTSVTAKAVFRSLPNIYSNYYYLSESDQILDFGNIELAGNKAYPEFEATKQNDADGDGISDFEDLDDDNDDILDSNETDCDSDGIIDDYDEDSSCSSAQP